MDYKAAMGGEVVSLSEDTRRLRYWALPIWEAEVCQNIKEVDLSRWPDRHLAQLLIDAYFENDNLTSPLLHRTIFQKDYDDCRWRRDDSFAKMCLCLFAVAARHVDHPGVYWHAHDEHAARAAMADFDIYRHSAGWRWMEVAIKMGKSFLKPANLEELQVMVVSRPDVSTSSPGASCLDRQYTALQLFPYEKRCHLHSMGRHRNGPEACDRERDRDQFPSSRS
jgi:hypothetical protein